MYKLQRKTTKDCNVSKLDKDDLNSMRCEDCEYTENKSRAYCHGVCNKTHEGKLRLCNRYINANSERNSPYLCKDHQKAVFEKKGEFKIQIVIKNNDVSYKGEHGHKYTVELCGKNRFLEKQEKKHTYDMKTENLEKLPEEVQDKILLSDITDEELLDRIFLGEEDNIRKMSMLSYYTTIKGDQIGRLISQRVAQFQPLQVDGETVLTREDIAKMAIKFMLENDIKPEHNIAKKEYDVSELMSILAMCTTSPCVFKKFVEKTGMLSEQLKRTPYNYLLHSIIELFKIPGLVTGDVPNALKYVYSCLTTTTTTTTTLSNEEFISIFWKFLRICDDRDDFDRLKIEIYKFFAEKLVEQKVDLTEVSRLDHKYISNSYIYEGYSPESMQDRIKTYGYYAYPQQEFNLSEQEKKNRLDLKWLKENVFSYYRSDWVNFFQKIIYTDLYEKPLLTNQYFRRKMASLGYPVECLGWKNIDPKSFEELTNDREFMSSISKNRTEMVISNERKYSSSSSSSSDSSSSSGDSSNSSSGDSSSGDSSNSISNDSSNSSSGDRSSVSIDSSIIGINSLFVDGWPLCLTEEVAPPYGEESGTAPYLFGIVLNSPEIIKYLKIWTQDNYIQFHAPKNFKENSPIPKNSSLALFNNPSEQVSIKNGIEFKEKQVGESELKLNDEDAKNLERILNSNRYLGFELFDPENKLQPLWDSWLHSLRTFIGYDIP